MVMISSQQNWTDTKKDRLSPALFKELFLFLIDYKQFTPFLEAMPANLQ